MTSNVRLAIVGAGMMGANHARVARQIAGVQLVAVVDPDHARATAAASGTDALVASSIDDIATAVDAAVVAAPTAQHVELAVRLAESGIHLLVEKPLAMSLEGAGRIVAAAERGGVVLAVGHVERFNAAVFELQRLVEAPLHIEATRVSPYTARVADGVIMDLMIHDLDIVLWLAGADAEVTAVAGVARSLRGDTEDLASATLTFSTGLTVSLNTSRLGQQKIRTLEIVQHDSVVTADLLRQDITIHRMTSHEYLSGDGRRYQQSSVVEIPFLEQRGEPLALELSHFIACVRGDATPRVSGAAGQRALALAVRISDAVTRT